MSSDRAAYRLVFLAMSRNQETYFGRLMQDMAVDGTVVNAKRPVWVGVLAAMVWLLRRRHLWAQWLSFRLEKGRLNGERAGRIVQFGLVLRGAACLAAVQKLCRQARPDGLVLMNGAHYKQQIVLAFMDELGVQPLFLELGCLPDTTAIDGRGVNYNGAVPRDPEFYHAVYTVQTVDAALVKRLPRKPVGEPIVLSSNYIFVPFQVYDDTQILQHSPWIDSMEALYHVLERCAPVLPEGWRFIQRASLCQEILCSFKWQASRYRVCQRE